MKCKACGKKQTFCIPVSLFTCSCGAVHEDGEITHTVEDNTPVSKPKRRVLVLGRKKR